MNYRFGICILAGSVLIIASGSLAHFQELIPSRDIVDMQSGSSLAIQIAFTHPMEDGPLMNMAEPAQFGVICGSEKTDLLKSLKPVVINGKTKYTTNYKVKAPGDHIFYIEPAPYWEPAEGKMIIHYTKVIVNAFGDEDGWDSMVGFPVEIEPLVRPYGLWTGNIFRGIVRKMANRFHLPRSRSNTVMLAANWRFRQIHSSPRLLSPMQTESSAMRCPRPAGGALQH